jgi:hypothetical protein
MSSQAVQNVDHCKGHAFQSVNRSLRSGRRNNASERDPNSRKCSQYPFLRRTALKMSLWPHWNWNGLQHVKSRGSKWGPSKGNRITRFEMQTSDCALDSTDTHDSENGTGTSLELLKNVKSGGSKCGPLQRPRVSKCNPIIALWKAQ